MRTADRAPIYSMSGGMELLFKIAKPILARLWLFTRGLTFGVRGIIIDRNGKILLIRHGYTPGWHFPGGGVEIGETALGALHRELEEEAAVTFDTAPEFHGLFHHPQFSSRDHVAVYIIRSFTWSGPPAPTREIAECRFFAVNELPADISGGTRRRLDEILNHQPASDIW